MLTTYPSGASLEEALWIDACDPTEDERRRVTEATRLSIPPRTQLAEIESTSRVRRGDGGGLYLSTSVTVTDTGPSDASVLGFILSERVLVTVRFDELHTFPRVAGAFASSEPPKTAEDVFLRQIESIVDYKADRLEALAAELTKVSRQAFRAEDEGLGCSGRTLKTALKDLGGLADHVSQVRDSLYGLERVVNALIDGQKYTLSDDGKRRIAPIQSDLKSLDEYREQLWTKVQFVLDATLGFVNIDQNEIVKFLTVVSTVGVPPVLIAGIYGMNFQHMPELSWQYGYPFAIALIVVSAIVPYVILRVRGWV